jgi:prohibitin 2
VGSHYTVAIMGDRNPMQDYLRNLQNMAQQTRRGGGGFGGMPQAPRGIGSIIGAVVLLGGGGLLLQNALFNVDGGHRAIKYRRISGVSKEIFGEGMHLLSPNARDDE